MSLFNSTDPDIIHAHTCVVNSLFAIPETPGLVFNVTADQEYLAAMVQRKHDRQRDEAINRAAERIARRARKQARHTSRIVAFQRKGQAA